MTRICSCALCQKSKTPVTFQDPPSGPAGPKPRPKPAADAQLRVEALKAAVDVQRFAVENGVIPLPSVRTLAEDYHRWLSTGSWG
jgi:hypothetical protein